MCLIRLLASLRRLISVSVHLRWLSHSALLSTVSVHLRRLALTVSVTSALTTSEVSSLRRLSHSALLSVVSVHLWRLSLAVSVTSALRTSEVSTLWSSLWRLSHSALWASLWRLTHSTLTVSDSIGSALQCYRLLTVTNTHLIFLSALKLITAIKYRIVALSLICR